MSQGSRALRSGAAEQAAGPIVRAIKTLRNSLRVWDFGHVKAGSAHFAP